MKQHWNYRVVAEKEKDGSWFYSIRDVYYNDNIPHSWGEKPQWASGDNVPELKEELENMLEAVQRKVIFIDKGKIKKRK